MEYYAVAFGGKTLKVELQCHGRKDRPVLEISINLDRIATGKLKYSTFRANQAKTGGLIFPT